MTDIDRRPHASSALAPADATDTDLMPPDQGPDPRPTPAEAALDEALDLLAEHDITFATLRDPGRDGRGVLEADVLVARGDRDRAEGLLGGLGFRRRPSWGRHPHRPLVRPLAGDPTTDRPTLDWLKLDLVTDLCFGPWHQWSTGAGDACLAERSPGPGARLAPPDELLARLLHALLDRGLLRGDDIAALARLAPQSPRPGTLGRGLGRGRAAARRWARLAAMVDEEGWADLLAATPALRRHLRARRPLRAAARHARNRSLRRTGRLFEGLAARGPLVALVGPDGTGKSTLAASVVATAGLPARGLYGGTYRSGSPRSAVPGMATARVVGRLLVTRGQLTWHRRRGRLVVLDRHPEEARPGAGDEVGPRARLRRRCLAATLPRPDLLLVLDAPASVLHARRPEHSVDHLERDRRRHLAMDVPTTTRTLDAAASPEAVRSQTIRLVWQHAVPSRVRLSPVVR